MLPVLNEEKNINKLILLLKKYLSGISHELIFVDDNSLDGTFDLIKKIKNKKISFYVRKKKN